MNTKNEIKGRAESGSDYDRLWDKYWIEGGRTVIHRDHITVLNRDRLELFRMTVDKVIKRSKEGGSGQRKVFIEGVQCHWVDDERKYQKGTFHTNELVPFAIAEKGIEEVNKWIGRSIAAVKKKR